jgi:hypothetical protein
MVVNTHNTLPQACAPKMKMCVALQRCQRLCRDSGDWHHSHRLTSYNYFRAPVLSPSMGRCSLAPQAAVDLPSSNADGSSERSSEHTEAPSGPSSSDTNPSAWQRLKQRLFGGPLDKQKLAGYGIAGTISYGCEELYLCASKHACCSSRSSSSCCGMSISRSNALL